MEVTMKFRPCIDIHNGKVKQIVGGTLKDRGDLAAEILFRISRQLFCKALQLLSAFRRACDPFEFRRKRILSKTKEQALEALRAYPQGLQVGGGITPYNAEEYLKAGASHVIVTSYVFQDGKLHFERLKEMLSAVGKERLVLDLSCRRRLEDYYIVTDRWQKFTDVKLTRETMESLSDRCDEFLIHAVDVEGKANGIERGLAELLSECTIPVTYAGGVHSFEDLWLLKELGKGRIDVTIGSALDLFGGTMSFEKVISELKEA